MPSRAPYLFPQGARLGEHNLILHASAQRHSVDSFGGPLSIKTVLRGRVSWFVSGRELAVDPSSFLILAAGERYAMNIDEPKPVETCCAFFAPGFVERIALDLTSPAEQALEAPDRIAPSLPYLSAVHAKDEHDLIHRVRTLASHCEKTLHPSGTEEDFLLLGAALLDYYSQVRTQAARVPAMRASTREELFRRLLTGREYMHSHCSNPVKLADVAKAASLSPFHFHRGFKHAFQQTPHEYLTAIRLAQARDMIQTGSGVLEACIAVGFSSPSAFNRLFRKRFGVNPSAVRTKFARSGKNERAASAILGA